MKIFTEDDFSDYEFRINLSILANNLFKEKALISFCIVEPDGRASMLHSERTSADTHIVYEFKEVLEPLECTLDHRTVKTMFSVMDSVLAVKDDDVSYLPVCPECKAKL